MYNLVKEEIPISERKYCFLELNATLYGGYMKSDLAVYDLATRTFRGLNSRNHSDDLQIGLLYFDRRMLADLELVCTICGFTFWGKDGIQHPIDIQKEKIIIFEGTYNSISPEIRAIFNKYNISPIYDISLSDFFYSWNLLGEFSCFDMYGSDIKLYSMILNDEKLLDSLSSSGYSLYEPINYQELCKMTKVIVRISKLDFASKDYQMKYKYLLDSLISNYYIRIPADEIDTLWVQICKIVVQHLGGDSDE